MDTLTLMSNICYNSPRTDQAYREHLIDQPLNFSDQPRVKITQSSVVSLNNSDLS